ncbi:hypothetical protein BSQ33_01565 [Vibrio gazogenes]|uniref:Uncharacterized protein n=1 Tax=Vibrio gazogenes TaxID=687 RepID=A0A1Z2SBP7_VIBGA|nr:hypothetical protein BSQ33_01565 [Vibrio gazogenes]
MKYIPSLTNETRHQCCPVAYESTTADNGGPLLFGRLKRDLISLVFQKEPRLRLEKEINE